MSQTVLKQAPVLSGSLEDTFNLQDEVRILNENIKIIQRTIEERKRKFQTIVSDNLMAGVRREGRFYLKKKPGKVLPGESVETICTRESSTLYIDLLLQECGE